MLFFIATLILLVNGWHRHFPAGQSLAGAHFQVYTPCKRPVQQVPARLCKEVQTPSACQPTWFHLSSWPITRCSITTNWKTVMGQVTGVEDGRARWDIRENGCTGRCLLCVSGAGLERGSDRVGIAGDRCLAGSPARRRGGGWPMPVFLFAVATNGSTRKTRFGQRKVKGPLRIPL